MTEGPDSSITDANIGTILSHFHWWILSLSAILRRSQGQGGSHDKDLWISGRGDFATVTVASEGLCACGSGCGPVGTRVWWARWVFSPLSL